MSATKQPEVKIPPLTIENAQLIYRNFAGRQTVFNAEGDRNFGIVLDDPQLIADLRRDKWNVKEKDPKEEGDESWFFLPVSVGYKFRPPVITRLTTSGRMRITEELVEMLDYEDIILCDVTLNPYQWEMPSGAKGVKAYLKTMYITVEEDALEAKYATPSLED